MATSVPNLVKITQIAVELWRFCVFFSKWRPAAILDFVTFQKWRHDTLRTVHVYHHAKFGDNISNGGRVIAILLFSKWPPAAILDFGVAQKWHTGTLRDSMATSVPNLVKISQIGAELWTFSFFKMAVGRHLGFCDGSVMTSQHVADCPCLPSCQIWWQ